MFDVIIMFADNFVEHSCQDQFNMHIFCRGTNNNTAFVVVFLVLLVVNANLFANGEFVVVCHAR